MITNYKKFILPSLAGLACGIFLFAWYHDWIIITIPPRDTLVSASTHAPVATYKKKVVLVYPKNSKNQQETKEILWSNSNDDNAFMLVQAWASLLYEEEIIHKKITVQTAAVSVTQDELLLSFDRLPFNKDDAAFKKLALVQTLLTTVHEQIPSIQKVRFLINHKPLNDPQLDFSQPWSLDLRSTEAAHNRPLKEALAWLAKPNLTIMIDPAGDARTTGRTIDDTFERSITLQCAQELKKFMEEHLPGTRVILTRFPGEIVEPLQNAAFANRMHADLYVSLACYKQTSGIPHCALYTFLYEPQLQLLNRQQPRLTLTPLSNAHQKYISESSALIATLYSSLQTSERAQRCVLEPLAAFPYKPLMGVHCAALGIEIGLPKKDDWLTVLQDIEQALLLCLLSNR
jgi:N-acetylmuramoyl-L-alanine amidase